MTSNTHLGRRCNSRPQPRVLVLHLFLATACYATTTPTQHVASATHNSLLAPVPTDVTRITDDAAIVVEETPKRLQGLLGMATLEDAATPAWRPTRFPATGKGVIIGFLDTGIDWRHLDFRRRDNARRSRILSIWDTASDAGRPPSGFGYGKEWTQEEIEGAIRGDGPEPPRDAGTHPAAGHGTYVAGAACGGGVADPRYQGVAPDAEIIMVTTSPRVTLLDAARYVLGRASEAGRPVVLNFSGSTSLSDFSFQRERLEDLLTAAPGRVMVASAGNGGEGASHTVFSLSDTVQYAIYTDADYEERGVALFSGYCAEGSDCWMGLGPGPDDVIWKSFTQLVDYNSAAAGREGKLSDLLWSVDSLTTSAGEHRGRIGWAARAFPGGISMQALVEVESTVPVRWYIAAKGDGTLHTWSHPQPDSLVLPSLGPQYRALDNRFTLQPAAGSAEVLAVGAYLNREIPARYGALAIGSLLPLSSRGPSLEGLLKPDIVAPGVLTSLASGTTTEYRSAAGTSGAAAIASGAAALYLEIFPDARNRQVMQALRASAARDSFTGPVPNTDWGHGKLDISRAIEGAPTTVASGEKSLPAQLSLSQNYPNPFNGATTIVYHLAQPGEVVLTIYDLLGQSIRSLVPGDFRAGRHAVTWDGVDDQGRSVGSGVYLYSLSVDDTQVSRRLVLLR